MSQRVILTTVFSSFNYGSSLQALAGKLIIQNVGYEAELVRMKSLVKGRDIRLKKKCDNNSSVLIPEERKFVQSLRIFIPKDIG